MQNVAQDNKMKRKLRQKWSLWRSRFYLYRPGRKRKLKWFYSQFIQPGDICFDIGAYLGHHAKVWLEIGAKRVVVLEPNPLLFEEIMDDIGLDGRVIPMQYAAAAESNKSIHLHISSMEPIFSTMAPEAWRALIRKHASIDVEWDQVIEVKTVTLDELIKVYGKPTFVKIDVEGMEHEVLHGLTHAVKALSFKYHTAIPYVWDRCLRILRYLGDYEYNWSFGKSLQLNSTSWLSYDEIYDILDEHTETDPSGEVYARLRQR